VIALEELEEEVAESLPVATRPAMSRDEYITAAYGHIKALVKKAKREGVPPVDAEILADKAFDWTMKDYERGGDQGAPYSRMDRAMIRALQRYREVRKGVVLPVDRAEIEQKQKARHYRKSPRPSLGRLEKEAG